MYQLIWRDLHQLPKTTLYICMYWCIRWLYKTYINQCHQKAYIYNQIYIFYIITKRSLIIYIGLISLFMAFFKDEDVINATNESKKYIFTIYNIVIEVS